MITFNIYLYYVFILILETNSTYHNNEYLTSWMYFKQFKKSKTNLNYYYSTLF